MKHAKTFVIFYIQPLLFICCLLSLVNVPVAEAKIVFCVDGDIFVMDDNGANRRRLTQNPLWEERHPRWSPDGKKIVFGRQMDKAKHDSYELFIMNADGTDLQRLTHFEGYDTNPSWSPDGKRIVFTSTRSGDVEVHVIELETRNITQLTGLDDEQGSAAADLSPDGTQIVYEKFLSRDFGFGHKNIYVMSANGENQRPLIIPNPPADADLITMRFYPRWSADGQRIVFSDCTHNGKQQKCRLSVMRITGRRAIKEIKDIYDRLGTNVRHAGACWMHNDRAILFGLKISSKPNANYDLYRYEFETRSLRRLTHGAEDEMLPHWIEGTLSVTPQSKKKVTWGTLKK